MKKIFNLLVIMAIFLLSYNMSFAESASTVIVKSEKAKISVTVPTSFTLLVKADGTTLGGNSEIANNSSAPIKIHDIKLTAESGWTLVSGNENLDKEKIGSKKLGLIINNAVGRADGTFDMSEIFFPVINRKESQSIIWGGVSTMFSNDEASTIGATIIYTIGFAK